MNFIFRKPRILKNLLIQVPIKFKNEFYHEIAQSNFEHAKYSTYIMFFILLISLAIDLINKMNNLWGVIPGYRFLFYSHIIFLFFIVIVMILPKMFKARKTKFYNLYSLVFWILIILNSLAISWIDQKINGLITVYQFAILGTAVLIYFQPFISFLMYFGSYLFFIFGLTYTQINSDILKSHILNSLDMTILSWIFSMIILNSKKSEFNSKKALQIQASTDYLTGCYNRRAFISRLREEIGRSKRDQNPISLILVDIDYFKSINDEHGHNAGDIVLMEFANCVKSFCRSYDFLGRYGGEEFIICLPNTPLDSAYKVAERLRNIIEKTEIQLPKGTINITVSLGVSSLKTEEDIEKLINRADKAMYEAKTKRNTVCVL